MCQLVIRAILLKSHAPNKTIIMVYFTLQLDEKGIPKDFLLGDIYVDKHRHLLFATQRQMELLKKAKVWFVDGTFIVAKDPFKQLLSVYSFILKNDVLSKCH